MFCLLWVGSRHCADVWNRWKADIGAPRLTALGRKQARMAQLGAANGGPFASG